MWIGNLKATSKRKLELLSRHISTLSSPLVAARKKARTGARTTSTSKVSSPTSNLSFPENQTAVLDKYMPAIRTHEVRKAARKLIRNARIRKFESRKKTQRGRLHPRVIGKGFVNVGNSCYINAILQALVHLSPLAVDISDIYHEPSSCALRLSSKWCAMCALQSLVISRYQSFGTSRRKVPTVFTSHLPEYASSLTPGMQEDAHEFLSLVLSALQNAELGLDAISFGKSTEAQRDKTLVSQLFEGTLIRGIICSVCGSGRAMTEPFQNVGVSLSSLTVEESINGMVSEETIDHYHCEECNNRQEAYRRTELLSAPRVLIANLHRFSAYGEKVHDHIDLSTTLKLISTSNGAEALYQLQAVVCHTGMSTHNGHYYTYVKGFNGRWYLLNDHKTTRVEEDQMKQDPGSYLLFYTTDVSRLPSFEFLHTLKAARKLFRNARIRRRQARQNTHKQRFPRPIGKGFVNVGNSCYINAILQALVHLPLLAVNLSDLYHTPSSCPLRLSSKWCAICALQSLVISRYQSIRSSRRKVPKVFTSHLADYAPSLTPGMQEDAHEFLSLVFNALQNAELGLDANSFGQFTDAECKKTLVSQLFEGSLIRATICSGCNTGTTAVDSFQNVGVSLSSVTVEQSINGMVSEEILDEYHCEECDGPQEAHSRTELLSAPRILMANLHRFSTYGGKIHTQIDLSTTLKLISTSNGVESLHQLQAVVCHAGLNTNCGHYYSYVKGIDGRWYLFNDHKVERVHETHMRQDPGAYLLFYSTDVSRLPSFEFMNN
ncbi:ubiquitin-specific protease [Melampsora larici-populina 98AG31]|uniref:Ubiquitin carboxyl-terminal hydrolase n=1 Tax=Melampsora larici-populina (strain 98AG31 / pathotype 3-4-7) TaxID=747676 RepID=F4S392_MELLP|nr:ubiquitin-specific protease [Melampsora larici-populina 98AG31]EGG00944.1 ubiquitin-specific protease [Melampsora larici-populina 98AG31]